MARTVLVTAGATMPFDALVEGSLHPTVISTLLELGYDKILIQYGRGHQAFLEARKAVEDKITVEGFDFSPKLEQIITTCELVISHAGTGSILDVLRAKRKLIVVVNASLMDNHQLEIATEFGHKNNLIVSTVSELAGKIAETKKFKFEPIPEPNSSMVASIINHEAGL